MANGNDSRGWPNVLQGGNHRGYKGRGNGDEGRGAHNYGGRWLLWIIEQNVTPL